MRFVQSHILGLLIAFVASGTVHVQGNDQTTGRQRRTAEVIIKETQDSVVRIEAIMKHAERKEEDITVFSTGFVISSDGLVLAAAHGLNSDDKPMHNGSDIRIYFNGEDNSPKLATIVAKHQEFDLALLRVGISRVRGKPLCFGSERNVSPGASLMALGFPAKRNVLRNAQGSFQSQGGEQGRWEANLNGVGQGFSGGPVLTETGDVIGIVWGGNQFDGNRTLFTPANYIVEFINALGNSKDICVVSTSDVANSDDPFSRSGDQNVDLLLKDWNK